MMDSNCHGMIWYIMVYLYMACAEHHMVASTDWVQGKFTGKPESPFFKWENPWKIDGFRFRFSLKPIHWLLLLWRSVRWVVASSPQAEGLKGASRSFRRAAGRMSSGHYSSNVFFKGGWLMDFWWLIDRFFLLEFSIEKSDCEWWCMSDFFLDCLLVTSEKPAKKLPELPGRK